MKLGQLNEALDHKITSGSEYCWTCWDDARYLDYESDFAHVSAVYNTRTQNIYEVTISIKPDAWSKDARPYRWLNPLTKDAYVAEAEKLKNDPSIAWDGVKWIDLETEEDFLGKAKDMFNGDEWDSRIEIPLDLEDDLVLFLALEAHKREITLNKMVEVILQEVIDRHKETV